METLELILCIALIVLAVFLVVAVLMQSGKSNKLSGTITGASSDSFYGKTKGRTADAILSKLTAIVAVLFAILVIAVYVIQAQTAEPKADEKTEGTSASTTVENDKDEEKSA
ncbi:MAG: preprotein translocase subunit SecG [Clostridia bacterium]|nr:preprotein translocase subunit SecG [Clostridia bacterium]MBQ2730417.1 preprotein translocase subunit SecG [Clostridia bacterium]